VAEPPDRLRFAAGDVALEVSPADGGRMSSFTIGGRELLVTEGFGPVAWGCYPMAPFAGRVREGRFTFAGRPRRLPLNWPPHAIHGVVFDRGWQVEDDRTLTIALAPEWPFRGSVVQRFDLAADRLVVSMELSAEEPMPATIGWHPWFRRRIGPDTPPVELLFEADSMYVRDAAGIPTGELVAPGPRPWDDCFTGVHSEPVLTWPGELRLAIASSCDHWVVYDEPADSICVEPQTGPPDALNLGPTIVEPGRPLVATMEWRWRRL
jgi:aldose 1-epimerase